MALFHAYPFQVEQDNVHDLTEETVRLIFDAE